MRGLVRIRLARMGRVHQPIYNIVVTNKRTKRDGKPIEVIGTYNPIPTPLTTKQREQGYVPTKDVALDFTRAKYWLGVGAQPTETIAKLLKKAGILYPEWPLPSKVSRETKAQETSMEGRKFV